MHHLEILNKLLKDELSATETYQHVLDEFRVNAEPAESKQLMPIYQAHKGLVSSLQALIITLGETPAEDSGTDTWTILFLGRNANSLGKNVLLKALQAGEKRGAEEYEEALQDPKLSSDIRSLIEWKLRYVQQSHIRTLDRLLDAAAA
jgi:hypothetical protein